MDCAILAFEAIDAMAGVEELAPSFRGRWSNERDALRFQVREATDTAKVLASAGCEPVPPGFQQRGDILLVPSDGFQCAHVCMGRYSLTVRPATAARWVLTQDVAGEGLQTMRLPG
jgi:hypothetical protein